MGDSKTYNHYSAGHQDKMLQSFKKMLDVNLPIIYINDYDYARVDDFIMRAIGEDGVDKTTEWNPASGHTNFKTRQYEESGKDESLVDFLRHIYFLEELPKGNIPEGYVVLKEIQDYIDEPEVKTLLELIAQRKLYDRGYEKTIIIESSVLKVPDELKHYVSYFDFDYPSEDEINALIEEHKEANGYEKKEDLSKLELNLKGMSRYDIDRMLDMAMSSNGSLGMEDNEMILSQKKRMVKNSGLLELVDVPYPKNKDDDALKEIGGLWNLKDYLKDKSAIINDATTAQEYGVSIPKGILLAGMPGCGKSLSAKCAASLFGVPLFKMDMGSLMGKYVGESESHLKQALRIAEAAAPCVLWIDEIEKGFAGIGNENGEVIKRMFGYFLSWMQEKTSTVYVIATSNDVSSLPPELKRKGRFDEIFRIDLPVKEEREEIFKRKIENVEKRRKSSEQLFKDIDYSKLASKTGGYNGADIEAIVNVAVEKSFKNFVQSKNTATISTEQLISVAQETNSISVSFPEQLKKMKEVFDKSHFKSASK